MNKLPLMSGRKQKQKATHEFLKVIQVRTEPIPKK
jgi:hypothetical protein